MNIGQRPLSVGEEETHMSPSIVTRDNNRYTLLHAFSYLHTRIYFGPNMLFTVYDNILSKLTYETLPALATYLPIKRALPSLMFLD